MGLFEERLRAARDERDVERQGSDDLTSAYLGGVVPLEALVARSETAAVAVRGLVAYPDGFELTLALWVRRQGRHGGRRRVPWGLHRLDLATLEEGEALPEEFLRFGIEFPDGATVTNLDLRTWRLSADTTEPVHGMELHRGGGSDNHYEQSWWVWPVPGSGALAFLCEWPAYQIGETRYEVNADQLRRAAERAQPVWPDLRGPSHRTRSLRVSHHASSGQALRAERRDVEP